MKTHNKKKKKWILWASLVLVAIVLVIVVVNRAKKSQVAIMPTYQQVQATTGDLNLTVYGSGSLEASDEVSVLAPMPGTVGEWYFKEGDEVQEGDILGVMDTDQCDTDIDDLKEKIETLQSSIENYEDELDNSVEYSPIDGVVKEAYVQAGSDVSYINQVYGHYMVLAPDTTMTVTFSPSGGYAEDEGDYVIIDAEGYDNVVGQVVSVGGGNSTAEFDAYIPSGTQATILDISGEEEIGSGTLACKDEVTISSNNKVAAVYAQAGQSVTKGQKLLKYDSSVTGSIESKQKDLADAEEELAELEAASPEIIATADGVLTSINNGDLTMGLTAAQISPLDAMDLVVSIDELDIAEIQEGQTATISIDALPDNTYTGTVTRISQVGSASGGVTTYDVTLTINNTDGIRLGMNASADILVDSRQDVVILPIDAIQYQGDRSYVLLANTSSQNTPDETQDTQDAQSGDSSGSTDQQSVGNAPGQGAPTGLRGASSEGTVQFIEVGLMNEEYAEITSGIAAGDIVLYTSASSSSSSNEMGFGMGGMMGGSSGLNGSSRNTGGPGGAPPGGGQ